MELKTLEIAAGVALAVAAISLGTYVYRVSESKTEVTLEIVNELNSIPDAELVMYNNTIVQGRTAIEAMRLHGKEYLVRVVTVMRPQGIISYDVTTRADSPDYINPNAVFLAELYRDINGSIVEIRFTQEGAVYEPPDLGT